MMKGEIKWLLKDLSDKKSIEKCSKSSYGPTDRWTGRQIDRETNRQMDGQSDSHFLLGNIKISSIFGKRKDDSLCNAVLKGGNLIYGWIKGCLPTVHNPHYPVPISSLAVSLKIVEGFMDIFIIQWTGWRFSIHQICDFPSYCTYRWAYLRMYICRYVTMLSPQGDYWQREKGVGI
jgi:hypothetical protein